MAKAEARLLAGIFRILRLNKGSKWAGELIFKATGMARPGVDL